MSTVVAMLHAGSRCAFPAQQVLVAEIGCAPGPHACLWTGSPLDETTPAQRTVSVSTGSGARSVACSLPRLVGLDHDRLWALPAFLEEILDMPHVVGLAEIEGELHWVIDARQLPTDAVVR